MVEGSLSDQKFVGEHSQAPKIHTHVVLTALEDLWGCVVKSAAVCSPSLVADGSPAKIAQFRNSATQNYILGFYISVRDAAIMEVFDSLSNLLDNC